MMLIYEDFSAVLSVLIMCQMQGKKAKSGLREHEKNKNGVLMQKHWVQPYQYRQDFFFFD